MPIPQRTILPTSQDGLVIQITDDNSRTLFREKDQCGYHSGCGALTECEHVYLRGIGADEGSSTWPRRIMEVGFGTGLAMLRTLDAYVAQNRPVHYCALEFAPLPTSILRELHLEHRLRLPELAERFLTWWNDFSEPQSSAAQGSRPRIWRVDDQRSVEVWCVDVRQWLTDAVSDFRPEGIYFDPFDPDVSPEVWEREVLQGLFDRLMPEGRLATYCVKGEIRRRLQAVGFEVRRVAGPPNGKREVLIAVKPSGGDREPC